MLFSFETKRVYLIFTYKLRIMPLSGKRLVCKDLHRQPAIFRNVPSTPPNGRARSVQSARPVPNSLENRAMSPPGTFADLIALAKADQALSDSRRRHVVSDLKCFVREADRQPSTVRATVDGARELIQEMRRRPLGSTRKRWSNIRSSVNFALARYCDLPEAEHWEAGRKLEGDWRILYDRISTDLDICCPLSGCSVTRAERHHPCPGIRGDVRGVPRLAGAENDGDRSGRAVPPHLPGLEPRRSSGARLAADSCADRAPAYQAVQHAGGPPGLVPGRGRRMAGGARS